MDWKEQRICIGLCNSQEIQNSEFFWNFQNILKPTWYITAKGDARIKAGALNQVARIAHKHRCSKIMFMDIDQTFPTTVIKQLIERDLPIVSGVYHLKKPPYSPVAGWVDHGQRVNQNNENWKLNYAQFPDNDDHLVEIDWCGVGCMLVDIDVFDKIYFPCFYDEWDFEEGRRKLGHDMLFCRDTKRAGYKIYADTLVQCGHIGNHVFDKIWIDSYYESGMDKLLLQKLRDRTKTAEYWNDIYSIELERNSERRYPDEWNELINHIPEGSKIADVGCGVGTLIEEISKHNSARELYGYDISPFAINRVKEKGFDGEVANFMSFSPNGKSFDVVVSSHVLEHVKDGVKFLENCASLLSTNPDSKLIATVPLGLPPEFCVEHEIQYTDQSLKETFEQVFEKVEVRKVGNGLMAIGSNVKGKANDMKEDTL